MSIRATFSYFQGMEGDMYQFYRIPKLLFTSEYFKNLSCEAKVLYGLMLDRMSLSIKNRWLDEEDRVYIFFSVEEIMEMLNCGRNKAVNCLKDLEQREGRIIRQGNMNKRVHIYRYVTEATFDSYMWQLIESKQKFISQIMTSKSPVRSCEDVDDTALSYAEVKALATGNPEIKEKMALDVEVSKLKLLKANFVSNHYRLEDDIAKNFPQQIAVLNKSIEGYKADLAKYQANRITDPEKFVMEVGGTVFYEKKEAGAALLAVCQSMKQADAMINVGQYQGFSIRLKFDSWNKEFILSLKNENVYRVCLGSDENGNIIRINNALEAIPQKLAEAERKLETVQGQLKNAMEEVKKTFPKEEELNQKLERLSELNALLNMDEKETVMEGEEEQDEPEKEKRSIHEKISAYKKSTQLENTEDRIGISSEICIG